MNELAAAISPHSFLFAWRDGGGAGALQQCYLYCGRLPLRTRRSSMWGWRKPY